MKYLVAIASLVALAAGAVFLYTLQSDDGSAEVAAKTEPAVATESDPPPAPLRQPAAEVVEPAAPETTRHEVEAAPEPVEEEEQEEPLASLDPATSRTLDVAVRFPEGAPTDDRLVVLAFAEERDFDELYGENGVVPRRLRTGAFGAYRGLVSTAPIGASGTAELSIPDDLETPHLALSGRYLYTEGTVAAEPGVSRVELPAELGAYVTGRLLPPRGDAGPFEHEARVRLLTDIADATSWDGSARRLDVDQRISIGERYEFLAVPPNKTITLAVEPEELAAHFQEGLQLTAGGRLEVDIALTRGARVSGRVLDAQGHPVAEANVEAKTRDFWGTPVFEIRETETDEEGRYDLEALRPGDVWVIVEHEDFLDYRSDAAYELSEGDEREIPDIELSEGGAISGVVMFLDGAPAPGTVVELDYDFSTNVAGTPVNAQMAKGAGDETTVGEDGSFEFRALGTGPFTLKAELDLAPEDAGRRAAGLWTAQLDRITPALGGEESGINLVLEEPLSVSGHVADAAGNPVAAFEVVAEHEGSQWYLPPSRTESQEFEDEDGAYTLTRLTRGKWKVYAKAEGFADSERVEIELPSDDPVDLTLLRPVNIAGLVLDPMGRPVPGAEVGPELEMTEIIRSRTGGGASSTPKAVTDSSGRFELVGLAPGRGELRAEKEGFARSEEYSWELGEGDRIADAVLELRVGGTVTGEVLGEDGNPKPSAQVIVQQTASIRRRTTQADEEGKFEVQHIDPGTWQVMSLDIGGEGGFDQAEMLQSLKLAVVELEDGGSAHVVLGKAPENPVVVRGSVTVAGRPVTDTMVSFVPADGGGIEKMKILSLDEDGDYETTLESPGDYLVTLQYQAAIGRQHSIEYRRRIPDVEAHELDFELPLGKISGRVTGPDGNPMGDVRITLTIAGGAEFGTVFGGQHTETTTGEDGDYELDFLRAGAYRVAAGGSILGGMFGQQAEGGRMVYNVDVREGQWVRGVDFRLEKPGKIVGVVRDHAGQPVAEAVVFVRDEAGNLLELFSLTTSNKSGRFEYEGLAPGRYTVSARSDTMSSAGDTLVRVESGQEAPVELILDAGTMLVVSLEDQSGKLVPAKVSVTDERGREMSGMQGFQELLETYNGGLASLEQNIGPLPPGTYVVRATAADGRSTKKTLGLAGQDERKLRLRLR